MRTRNALPLLPVLLASSVVLAGDVLPSWNEGPAKKAIVDFVTRVTTEGGADFVPAPERIAVFDNDGTLWCEQPIYVQFAFVIDRIRALAPQHPEWQDEEPFRSLLAGDLEGVIAAGEQGAARLVAATHAGMTTDEFARTVSDWIATAEHPQTGRRYTQMVYQPMLELLDYLRAHGFKTYIVSGGGEEFIRPWSERVYGVPPEQVVGSRGKLKLEMRGGEPVLVNLPEIELLNDGPGKPVGIRQAIGRRPILAFGNSDGDFEMLDYVTSSAGLRLGLLVHHDDAGREFAYDRESRIGRLARGLDEAQAHGWVVVSMKRGWLAVFPAGAVGEADAPGTTRCTTPAPSGASAEERVMAEEPTQRDSQRGGLRTDLAFDRTLMAWIRTALTGVPLEGPQSRLEGRMDHPMVHVS